MKSVAILERTHVELAERIEIKKRQIVDQTSILNWIVWNDKSLPSKARSEYITKNGKCPQSSFDH